MQKVAFIKKSTHQHLKKATSIEIRFRPHYQDHGSPRLYLLSGAHHNIMLANELLSRFDQYFGDLKQPKRDIIKIDH